MPGSMLQCSVKYSTLGYEGHFAQNETTEMSLLFGMSSNCAGTLNISH